MDPTASQLEAAKSEILTQLFMEGPFLRIRVDDVDITVLRKCVTGCVVSEGLEVRLLMADGHMLEEVASGMAYRTTIRVFRWAVPIFRARLLSLLADGEGPPTADLLG